MRHSTTRWYMYTQTRLHAFRQVCRGLSSSLSIYSKLNLPPHIETNEKMGWWCAEKPVASVQHTLYTNNKWHHSVFSACILLHSCRRGIKLCLQTDTKGEQRRPSKSERQQRGGSEVLVQTAHWLSVTSWWDKVGRFASRCWFSLALQAWCSMQISSCMREWMKGARLVVRGEW